MAAAPFTHLVYWVIAHGYFIFFLAALIEGPLVTAAAGIAAGMGYFNIAFIILIGIGGDIGADIIYYAIGYTSRNTVQMRWSRYIGLSEKRVEKIEKLLHEHTAKTVLLVKLSPIVCIPGLIIIGRSRVPLRKFFTPALALSVPKTAFFALVGFFSGKAYESAVKVVSNSQYVMLGLVIAVILVYIVYEKFARRATREIVE